MTPHHLSVLLAALLTALPLAAQTARTEAPPQPRVPDTAVEAKTKAGQLAAAGWLQLLDASDWGGSWERASLVFRMAVPLSNWMDGVPQLRKPFGSFVSRTAEDSGYKNTLPGRPPGDYVTSRFVTDFSNRKGVEEFVTTVLDPDGKWRVTGYTAR